MNTREAKLAAIAPLEGGAALLARLTEGGVSRLAADGSATWTRDVPAGRFPIPPTVSNGRVYLCSNRGLLSVLATADGALQWQYQATPGFYVMAPVAVHELDGAAVAFVAGMDGMLVAVRHR
jgi:outer membrane protein assembly factor BamB